MGVLAKTLNQLIDPQPAARTLPAMKPADPIPAKVGLGVTKGAAAASSGGIASPLTETAYTDREYWSDAFLATTDGLFTLEIKPVKALHFTDAAGAPVEIDFGQPS